MIKKLVCFSLVAILLLSLLSSCGKSKKSIIVIPQDRDEDVLTNDEDDNGTDGSGESQIDEIPFTDISSSNTTNISEIPTFTTADLTSESASDIAEVNSTATNATTTTTAKATTTTAAKYNLTLYADGVDGYPKTFSVTKGSTVNLPSVSKTGYDFDGWYTSKSGGSRFTSSTAINENTNLYAQWIAKKYTVILVNNGSVYTTIQADYGSSVSLPTLTNESYNFNGWFTENGEKYTSSTKITNDVTLYSKWSIKEFTVSLNSNGGNQSYKSITVNYGSTVDLPTPTKDGNDFVGWYDSKSGGTLYTSSTRITSNVTLYARWSAKTYTVSFDSNGGSPSYNSVNVKYGSTVNLPSPTREGYNLLGWYNMSSGGDKYTSSTKITENVTLYAHWEKKVYTVKYDSDGGTSYNSQKVEYGTSITLPTPKKTGYTFDGWYSAKSGGSKYGSSVKITSDITFYAHWTGQESDWVDSVPSGATKTQTRTVYRYRTRSEEPVYSTKTQYQYAYYACNKCGVRWYGPCYHSELGSSCSGYITGPYTAWFDFAPLTTVSWRVRTGDGSVYSFNNGSGDFFYTTNTHTLLYQYMQTRETRVQTGTQYTNWGSWSSWSTTNPGSSTNLRQVESKTQYKYRYN